jgi:hypothetical protein
LPGASAEARLVATFWRWRSSFSAELRGPIGCFLFLFCLSVSKSQGHFFQIFSEAFFADVEN